MADPTYAAVAPIATVQVAASVIVTAVMTPILTSFVYQRLQRQRALAARAVPNQPMSVAVAPGDG